MKPIHAVVAGAVLVAGPTFWNPSARADSKPHVEPLQVFSGATPKEVPAERTYFRATGASPGEVAAFRRDLIEAGAGNVNVFVSDLDGMVVVAEIPSALEGGALVDRSGFARFREAQIGASRAAGGHDPLGWIREAYAEAERQVHGTGGRPGGASGTDDGFRDAVLRISPERAREIQREIEAARAQRAGAPTTAAPARNVNQNSEFLGGGILAQFIFPESDGSKESQQENWTEDDLVIARRGATTAMLSWQGRWPGMKMTFVIRFYEKVPTGYEPITHNMDSDALWIIDTMHNLGYGLDLQNELGIVHEFNTEKRALWGTNWVVSSFIANSRNAPFNRFNTNSYTAYANLGGPYMVQPFPSGLDPNNIGFELVYSQIVQHEVGHEFWALDEYPGAPGSCASVSGYLNYANGNISMSGPGGMEARCEPLSPCVMHVAGRQDLGRPWCRWTEGQFGVIDDNNNAVPDIYEAEPIIRFEVQGPETVMTNEDIRIRFRGISKAVPNNNQHQDADQRVSYAVPLREGAFSLGGGQYSTIQPLDGDWNSIEEDAEIRLSNIPVGRTRIAVTVRNQAGFGSLPHYKDIYFIGVNFGQLSLAVRERRIDVGWQTIGEAFGAEFAVYRSAAGGRFEMVADKVSPEPVVNEGFVSYRFIDRKVEPGVEYAYYVRGSFTLAVGQGEREFSTDSGVIKQTAMIPVSSGIVSVAAPNPFRERVQISVVIPQSFVEREVQGPTGTTVFSQRVATDVDVAIYDVAGRLVKRIRRGAEFRDVLTVSWDGTNVENRLAPSGIYFVRAKAGDAVGYTKVLLVR